MRGLGFVSKYLLSVLPGVLALMMTSCGKYVPEGVNARPVWTARGWMELPQIDPERSDCAFFTRDMHVGTSLTRNYSFYWDYSDRVSLWVAYPLSTWNMGSQVGRSQAFGFDPLLPAREQSDVSRGYSVGNDGLRYDRGHQIPSADRQGSYANNASTFYGTNMTPQSNAFNTGLWSNLESCVRKWASRSDTLYVVTGCVVERGMKKYVTDASDNKVAIPAAYWKALLRYSRPAGSDPASSFSACAFYFDHAEYGSGPKAALPVSSSLSIPVSDLEDILGCRLFVNLDAAVGAEAAAAIRRRDPAEDSWWWAR